MTIQEFIQASKKDQSEYVNQQESQYLISDLDDLVFMMSHKEILEFNNETSKNGYVAIMNELRRRIDKADRIANDPKISELIKDNIKELFDQKAFYIDELIKTKNHISREEQEYNKRYDELEEELNNDPEITEEQKYNYLAEYGDSNEHHLEPYYAKADQLQRAINDISDKIETYMKIQGEEIASDPEQNEETDHYIKNLVAYTGSSQQKIIESLLKMAHTGIYIQSEVVKTEKDLEKPENSFYITLVTELFNLLYPTEEN